MPVIAGPTADLPFKIVSMSRDLSTGSGNQDSPSLGFDPIFCIVQWAVTSANSEGGLGMSDGTVDYCSQTYFAEFIQTNFVYFDDQYNAVNIASADMSLGTDKFVINWNANTGSPVGTMQMRIIAFGSYA